MTLKAESLVIIVVFFVVQMRLLVLWKTEQPQSGVGVGGSGSWAAGLA